MSIFYYYYLYFIISVFIKLKVLKKKKKKKILSQHARCNFLQRARYNFNSHRMAGWKGKDKPSSSPLRAGLGDWEVNIKEQRKPQPQGGVFGEQGGESIDGQTEKTKRGF